jgi:hypothetical protein
MSHNDKIQVVVHFSAAGKPFKDEVDRSETVGQFKPRVLKAFGLHEGQGPDGSNTTYTLYHDKAPLENPNQTLGEIAGDKKILQLKLSQQITQG